MELLYSCVSGLKCFSKGILESSVIEEIICHIIWEINEFAVLTNGFVFSRAVTFRQSKMSMFIWHNSDARHFKVFYKKMF